MLHAISPLPNIANLFGVDLAISDCVKQDCSEPKDRLSSFIDIFKNNKSEENKYNLIKYMKQYSEYNIVDFQKSLKKINPTGINEINL
jgi:hypothetical protein